MNKEIITDKQAIYLLILFIIGNTLVLGTGARRIAKNDAWIAIILGIILALPMVFIYSRLLSLFKGMDIFDILKLVFGNVLGKILALAYIWYAIHLGALDIRNFGEFSNTIAMSETPMLVPMLLIGLLCIGVVRAGVEVLGRCGKIFFPVVFATLIIVQLLAIPDLNFSNIKPVLGNGIFPVLKGAFWPFSFSFAETVLFTTVFFALKADKSAYRVYFSGLFIGGAIIVLVSMRNILVLGADVLSRIYFPAYVAVSRISIGDFLQRIEVSISIVLVVGIFIKASVCLFAACKGISKVFGLKSYRSIVLQTGLLMTYFSYIIYDNIMEMEYWVSEVYVYYAFPFQVILPIIILVIAEVKIRTGKLQTGKEG